MKPKEVLEKWIDCFNKADAYHIAELYATNAVNHQVANESNTIFQLNKYYQNTDWEIEIPSPSYIMNFTC